MIELNKIYNEDCGDTMKRMNDGSINMVMTSSPYWALRDYGIGKNQLGLEPTFDLYIKHLCDIFDEVKRVLRKDGTCWVNLGDTYNANYRGSSEPNEWHKQNRSKGEVDFMGKPPMERSGIPPKSLTMIPFRFAIEMVNRGWILRNTIIWHKKNCMPSSAKDRFTVDFEYLFFFSKKKKYYFEQQFDKANYDGRKDTMMKGSRKYNVPVIPNQPVHSMAARGHERWKEVDGVKIRNKRTVWTINPTPFSEAHFAVYPEKLCEIPIKSGCPIGGIVYDLFAGSGTTGLVAYRLNRHYILSEMKKEYCEIAEKRLSITKQIQFT